MRAGSSLESKVGGRGPDDCRTECRDAAGAALGGEVEGTGAAVSHWTVASLGVLLGYVMLTASSDVSLADLGMTPQTLKGPLALSGGAGILMGFVVAAIARQRLCRGRLVSGVGMSTALAWALCIFALLREGCLVDGGGLACVLLGDALTWACVVPLLFVWCRMNVTRSGLDVLRVLGFALMSAMTLFLAVTLMPVQMGRLVVAIVLPATFAFINAHDGARADISGAAFTPAAEATGRVVASSDDDPYDVANLDSGPSMKVSLAGTLFLLPFVASFLTDLLPVGLNAEVLVNSLNVPAAYLVVYLVIFSVYLLILPRFCRPRPLNIYGIAVIMLAVGYLSLPFSTVGGFALSIFAAGEIIAFIFVGALLCGLYLRGGDRLVLRGMLPVCGGMVASDVLCVAMQASPVYDYYDFSVRTAIAAVAVIVIFTLALVLLPRTEEALTDVLVAPTVRPASEGDSLVFGSASLSGVDPVGGQLDRFVARFGLSPREADIVAFIASGRDVPYIERELGLAKSTVKTHIKHIYEKCGVSSRQALLDLLEVV